MRRTSILIAASTALTGAIGLTAWSASGAQFSDDSQAIAAVFDRAYDSLPLILASSDDDDHKSGYRGGDDDDDDDDCEDDDGGCNSAGNPAPAGTVAPPQNGLFGNGSAPQVQVK